ncbi:MAG: hypothetical protein U5L72_13765 [Bacteroidales bacterium]|nr:hypothetical protein [Bacteroidales bacterium]
MRTQKDRRSAWIRWNPVDDAYAYNVYMGTEPDKLYNCIMIYGANEYWLKTMDIEKTYYFSIEAINENGVTSSDRIIKIRLNSKKGSCKVRQILIFLLLICIRDVSTQDR